MSARLHHRPLPAAGLGLCLALFVAGCREQADMRTCRILPAPDRTTAQAAQLIYEQAGFHEGELEKANVTAAALEKIEDNCITRQAYLRSRADGDLGAISQAAVGACAATRQVVKASIQAMATQLPRHQAGYLYPTYDEASGPRLAAEAVSAARIGRCWAQ